MADKVKRDEGKVLVMHTNLSGIFKVLIVLSGVTILIAQPVPLTVMILAAVVYNAILMFIYRRYIYHCTKRLAPELLLEVHSILNVRVSSRPDISSYPVELLQLIKEYDSVWSFLMIVWGAALVRGIISGR